FAHKTAPRLLHRLAGLRVNHAPIVFGEFLLQMGRSLGQQVPELVISTALKREARPLRLKRRGQARVAVDHRQHRDPQLTRDQRMHRVEPGTFAFRSRKPQVQNHAAAIGTHAQRDQHRYPHPLFPDPHPRIPAVQKQVTNLQRAEIPTRPGRKILPQPSHQARDRVLRQRRSAQQRRQRSAQPPGIGAAQIHSQDRLVDALRAPLVARDDVAAPLALPPIGARDSCSRQRDGARPKAGGQSSRTLAVPVSHALRANSLRARRAQRFFQFFLDDDLDGVPNPLAQLLLERAFSLPSAPAIPLHSVILRHPPPSGRELWLNSPDLDAFSLFHQLPDTTVLSAISKPYLFADVALSFANYSGIAPTDILAGMFYTCSAGYPNDPCGASGNLDGLYYTATQTPHWGETVVSIAVSQAVNTGWGPLSNAITPLLTSTYAEALMSKDQSNPLYQQILASDTYLFVPKFPVTLVSLMEDSIVTRKNSDVAFAYFTQQNPSGPYHEDLVDNNNFLVFSALSGSTGPVDHSTQLPFLS